MQRFLPMLIIIFSLCMSVTFCGCTEPVPKVVQETGSGKTTYEPGAMNFHRAIVKYLQPKEDYTLFQKRQCYQAAIPFFLSACKAMADADYPMKPERVFYTIFAYRELADVEFQLGNAESAKVNFNEALKWCDKLESRFHGRNGAYYYRATIYRLMAELEKAEQAAVKDVEIRPDVLGRKNVLLLEDIRRRLARKRYRVPLKKPEKEKK
ncbi:MAG: tetratricopeptide repeat protein [Planctomycetota bacterium]|nr:MAG: tetratricopeptide repeat protein [Planctomycetota bacterium]